MRRDDGYLVTCWKPIVNDFYDTGGVMVLVELSPDGKRYIARRLLTREEALTRPIISERHSLRSCYPGEKLPDIEPLDGRFNCR